MTDGLFEKVKESLTIAEAWRKLALPGDPKRGVMRSPFRADKTPSFSIYGDGRKWKDHSTGDGGDVIDFWAMAKGQEPKDVILAMAEALGIPADSPLPALRSRRFKRLMPAPARPDAKISRFTPESCRFDAIPDPLGTWLHAKGITRRTVLDLARQGRIGLQGSQIVFFYETGTKVRRELADSHSCYWAAGFAESPWLVQECDSPAIRRVCICEGESDTMRLRALVGPDTAVIGMPGASWRPSPVMCWRIGAFREVILCFDGDRAGHEAEDRIASLMLEHARGVRLGRMEMEDGKDVCTTSQKILTNFLANPVPIR